MISAELEAPVVTSPADHGAGSLRQALLEAAATPGPHLVTFDPVVFAEPIPLEITAILIGVMLIGLGVTPLAEAWAARAPSSTASG